jgi:hypothetical protein
MIAYQRVVSFVKYSFRIVVEWKEVMILELSVKCIVTEKVSNCSVDRDKWLAVVNMAMNIRVSLNSGKLLSIYGTRLLKKVLFP